MRRRVNEAPPLLLPRLTPIISSYLTTPPAARPPAASGPTFPAGYVATIGYFWGGQTYYGRDMPMPIVSNAPEQNFSYWLGKVYRPVTDSAGNMYAFLRGTITSHVDQCGGREYFIFVRCANAARGQLCGDCLLCLLLLCGGDARSAGEAACCLSVQSPPLRTRLACVSSRSD